MESPPSKRAEITSRGYKGVEGLIKEREDTIDVTKEGSTGETTSSRTNQSSQPSDHGQKFDVFLSHSGKQKNLVRQLHKDLTNQGVSCFFDQDRESLPVAEHFPSRIFEAAKTCKVAVLLLSKDFLEGKWPMLELSAFVEAKDTTNPNLKIFPLFFLISPDALKNTEDNDKKWKRVEKSSEERAKWHRALKAIRPINGLVFGESGDEVKFRDEIVKEIWHILPTPSPRYHVRGMQGEERMCQEVANFFNKVEPNKKGIRIAGLYGIAGHGKTTLGKAFCNFKLGDFEGNVCHLEFSRGDSFERINLALQYLTHRRQSDAQPLTNEEAKVELYRRVKDKKVLLVLDNITEESIEEVAFYSKADLGENSWILLSARSVNVLEKHFIEVKQSCMRIPSLTEEEAISILLERAFAGDPKLEAEERGFALKCAKRCLFEETCSGNVRMFHALALKAFGGYLFSKHSSNLSKWAAEIHGMVDRAGDGLDEFFTLLGKAFDDMCDKYRTIFMLLTLYMLPNMSREKVTEWMAINCNEEISFIEKAVEDLRKKAFIEEFKPEIRIHDLHIEFAQRKANEMKRWLWWKKEDDQFSRRRPIAQDEDGFELAKLEQCMYQRIVPKYLGKLLVLQLVDVDVKNMSKIDLGPMDSLRSITLRDCKLLVALDGMEKLSDLAWLQIRGVHPMFKLPELSSLVWLQYLELDVAGSQVVDQLGDLTHCSRLREINVLCPSLLEFPRLEGMPHLEKVEFSLCDKVKGPLNCTQCVELQTIVIDSCSQMTASPLLTGCKKLSKLVLSQCDSVMACPDVDVPSALKTLELFISSKTASAPKNLESCCELENLQLWNIREVMQLPSFKRLSNLTVLKLGKCGIREPPDLTGCNRLDHVYFFALKNLERFPSFSSVRELKKLSLCNCISVEDPPDIEGCHQLQVLHLLYNDHMKGLPKMDKCGQLENIQLSWHCNGDVTYEGLDPDNCQVDEDLESCLEYWKDEKFGNISDVSMPEALREWQWVKGKTKLVKRYFRGVKLYYSLTAPYSWISNENGHSKCCSKSLITLRLIDSRVTAFPTLAGDCQDRDWLKKVREYFAGKKYIASASASSGSLLLPLSRRYIVPPLQGEARMCQEVTDLFNTVQLNERGIRIAGLYGMPGQGKTTIAKAFCNKKLRNFDGKVCHLEFCGGNTLLRQKFALHDLTEFPTQYLTQDDAQLELYRRVKGQRVLLVLDNITEQNIDEVGYYLGADLGGNSWILLSARSLDVLVKHFNIDSQSCMRVPRLEEEEAIAILWERKPSVASGFPAESRDFALKCAKKFSIKEDGGFTSFHPLALKVFGRHLFRKQFKYLSKWGAEIDRLGDGFGDGLNDMFVMLDEAFEGIDDKCRTIFMLLTRHIPPNMSTKEVFTWLRVYCNERIAHVEKAVADLYESAFIEEIEPEIRIHELLKEFAQMNNKNKYDIVGTYNG